MKSVSLTSIQKQRIQIIQSHLDYLTNIRTQLEALIDLMMDPYESIIKQLCTIPGIKRKSAITIISEIGVDIPDFSSHIRLAS